jgi:hypothetical protein
MAHEVLGENVKSRSNEAHDTVGVMTGAAALNDAATLLESVERTGRSA